MNYIELYDNFLSETKPKCDYFYLVYFIQGQSKFTRNGFSSELFGLIDHFLLIEQIGDKLASKLLAQNIN